MMTSCAATRMAVPTPATLPSGRRYSAPKTPRATRSRSSIRPAPGTTSNLGASSPGGVSYARHISLRERSMRFPSSQRRPGRGARFRSRFRSAPRRVRRVARRDELGEEGEPARLEEVEAHLRAGEAHEGVRDDRDGEFAGELLAVVRDVLGGEILAEDFLGSRRGGGRVLGGTSPGRRGPRAHAIRGVRGELDVEPLALGEVRQRDVLRGTRRVPREKRGASELGEDGHVQEHHLDLLQAQGGGADGAERGEPRLFLRLGRRDAIAHLRARSVGLLLAQALLLLRRVRPEKRAQGVDRALGGRFRDRIRRRPRGGVRRRKAPGERDVRRRLSRHLAHIRRRGAAAPEAEGTIRRARNGPIAAGRRRGARGGEARRPGQRRHDECWEARRSAVAKRGIDVASSFAKVALIFCSGLTHAGVLP